MGFMHNAWENHMSHNFQHLWSDKNMKW